MRTLSIFLLSGLLGTVLPSQKPPFIIADNLRNSLTFYASFDQTLDADFTKGDNRIHTADSYDKIQGAVPGFTHPYASLAARQGRFGGALRFSRKSDYLLFYAAEKNVDYQKQNWSGTVSFWLQLDPAKDLEPGYCDPIQLTDVAYNDAALWVDFTDQNPRDFRLGVIGDLNHWNPENEENEAAFQERLVVAEQFPFTNTSWTHVLISFSKLNSEKGVAKLYLDGKLQGTLQNVTDPFTWDASKANIILGYNYVGLFDELAIFNKALSEEEVALLYQIEGGVKTLFQ